MTGLFPSGKKMLMGVTGELRLKETEVSLGEVSVLSLYPKFLFKLQYQQSNIPVYLHFAILLLLLNKLCFYNFLVLQNLKCVSLF
jgi:hypothetical protein